MGALIVFGALLTFGLIASIFEKTPIPRHPLNTVLTEVEFKIQEIREQDEKITRLRSERRKLKNTLYGEWNYHKRESNLSRINILDISISNLVRQRSLVTNPTRRMFTEAQRHFIFTRDHGICQICLEAVEYEDYHCDHIIPYSRGGHTTIDNGQCTHSLCNMKKGSRVS